jgi:hypothetical protein
LQSKPHLTQRFPAIFGLPNAQIDPALFVHSRLCIELIDEEKPIDKDFIILSTVRSTRRGGLGELQDGRLLNSFLLKARRGAVLVGNLSTLARVPAFRDFIIWGQSNSILLKYS